MLREFTFVIFLISTIKALHDPDQVPPGFQYTHLGFSADGRLCEKCMSMAQGENLPGVNWDTHPGPCYPPEVPDCRGTPWDHCWRWWIPCGYYSVIEFWPCCWTDGPYATSVCRQPEYSAEEYWGSRHYKYCLPLLGADGTPRSRGGSRGNKTIQFGPEGAGNNNPLEPSNVIASQTKPSQGSGAGGSPTHKDHEQKMIQQLTKIADKLEAKRKKCQKKKNAHS